MVWTGWGGLLWAVLLLYDAPVRRGLKLMPLWTRLRREAEG